MLGDPDPRLQVLAGGGRYAYRVLVAPRAPLPLPRGRSVAVTFACLVPAGPLLSVGSVYGTTQGVSRKRWMGRTEGWSPGSRFRGFVFPQQLTFDHHVHDLAFGHCARVDSADGVAVVEDRDPVTGLENLVEVVVDEDD